MGLDIGTYTILTTNHPEEIKYALKHVFPKKNIILSQETDRPYPLHVPHVSDIATTLVTMSRVKGLESMEFTQSNTFKFNFIDRHNRSTLSSLPPTLHNIRGSNGVPSEHAPPTLQTSIRPSAQPIPTTPDLVYGYPWPSAPPSPKTQHQVYGYPHPDAAAPLPPAYNCSHDLRVLSVLSEIRNNANKRVLVLLSSRGLNTFCNHLLQLRHRLLHPSPNFISFSLQSSINSSLKSKQHHKPSLSLSS
ncbi:hypothetical protein L1987_35138 [Smallanthus sonchifolius]|uniref:Uncharacterized protein n=1 Tax=Smallanthus sonchifolius TaxID=185202 RepID=A0ACB9HVS8_9ASTR|nr:hypothetical protein L1987_35138 [Smallanthus sonchifolius]